MAKKLQLSELLAKIEMDCKSSPLNHENESQKYPVTMREFSVPVSIVSGIDKKTFVLDGNKNRAEFEFICETPENYWIRVNYKYGTGN